jgi:aspartyl-tRNA(Asn)/glutamyl-tRNA(Gln) amidotransferase subunit C
MVIDKTEILKVAHLARLTIEDQDIEKYLSDLNNILDLIAEMNEADTSEIEPLSHPLDMTQRLRPDEVTETNQRAIFQGIAPQVENGLYVVPKVIEE